MLPPVLLLLAGLLLPSGAAGADDGAEAGPRWPASYYSFSRPSGMQDVEPAGHRGRVLSPAWPENAPRPTAAVLWPRLLPPLSREAILLGGVLLLPGPDLTGARQEGRVAVL